MRLLPYLLQAFGPRLLVASICIAAGVLLFGHWAIVPQHSRWWVLGIFLITAIWSVSTSIKPLVKTIVRACTVAAMHPFIWPLSGIEKQILFEAGRSADRTVNLKRYSYGGEGAASNLTARAFLRKLEQRGLIFRSGDLVGRITDRGVKWASKVAIAKSKSA